MSELTYSALRAHHRTVAGMLADPDCTGDLLLIGMAVARHVELEPVEPSDPTAGLTWGDICGPWLRESAVGIQYLIDRALQKDIRRYDPLIDAGQDVRCTAPMIRRAGACGQRANMQVLVRDAESGRGRWIAACPRHRDWHRQAWAQARMVKPVTQPAANAGGVLPRHIPRVNWAKEWKRIDPGWTAPPEESTQPRRPALRLLNFEPAASDITRDQP